MLLLALALPVAVSVVRGLPRARGGGVLPEFAAQRPRSTEQTLREYFQAFGGIEIVKVPKDLSTGACKGSAEGRLSFVPAGRAQQVDALSAGDGLVLQNSGVFAGLVVLCSQRVLEGFLSPGRQLGGWPGVVS